MTGRPANIFHPPPWFRAGLAPFTAGPGMNSQGREKALSGRRMIFASLQTQQHSAPAPICPAKRLDWSNRNLRRLQPLCRRRVEKNHVRSTHQCNMSRLVPPTFKIERETGRTWTSQSWVRTCDSRLLDCPGFAKCAGGAGGGCMDALIAVPDQASEFLAHSVGRGMARSTARVSI